MREAAAVGRGSWRRWWQRRWRKCGGNGGGASWKRDSCQRPQSCCAALIAAVEAAEEPSEHVDASAMLTQRTYGGEQTGSKRGHTTL